MISSFKFYFNRVWGIFIFDFVKGVRICIIKNSDSEKEKEKLKVDILEEF